jgi:hypothetical protein
MVRDMLLTACSHFKGMPYKHLILKDPELTLLVDLIPRFFGERSKVVCVVRDPRAVIASMVAVERGKRIALWSEFRRSAGWRVFYNKRSLAANIFNYYWKAHSADLFKSGAMHIVRFENIAARDEEEFQRLEAFLGFPVGRDGFGKVHFDFDRRDPFYSPNYGKTIKTPANDFRRILNKCQIAKIEKMFSGYNALYKWWGE